MDINLFSTTNISFFTTKKPSITTTSKMEFLTHKTFSTLISKLVNKRNTQKSKVFTAEAITKKLSS